MLEDLIKSEVRRVVDKKEEEIEKHVIKKIDGFVTSKTPWQKFKSTFIEEDLPSVGSHLYNNVIIPGIKGIMADVVIGWAERTFGVGSGRRAGRRIKDSLVRSIFDDDYVDYSSSSRRKSQSRIEEKPKFTLDDVVMRDRAAAQDLLDTLRETIKEYDQVSVGELYDILDRTESAKYTDNYYGWKDLNEVPIRRTAYGYRLVLPQPIELR